MNFRTADAAFAVDRTYVVRVPYRGQATIRELVQLGHYDQTSRKLDDASFHFSRQADECVSIHLLSRNGSNVSMRDILTAFAVRRLRPANAAEMLALGAQQPDLQLLFAIITFETPWFDVPFFRPAVSLRSHIRLFRKGYRINRIAEVTWVTELRNFNGSWLFAGTPT